ncbi:MAG: pantetheine-phosphate adenylyltransferase [Alphaproteobacteria bacterium]|nr:pantetheine-phosphate adenylyltransferase [Alphaproteobacteria bacterium]
MARTAIYAGSFDPVTHGHVDVIHRGAALFDTLVVAVGHNPGKRYLFDLDTRASLVRAACADCANVQVVPFSGLLVDTARSVGADVILRGLRALSDFDLEFRNGLANRELSGIETLFLLSDPSTIFVSSSLVREIAQHGGDVSGFVSEDVARAVHARYAALAAEGKG